MSKATRDVAARRAAVAAALKRRDATIRRAFADGWPIGALAEAASLTPARVASILGHPFQRVGRPSTSAARASTTT